MEKKKRIIPIVIIGMIIMLWSTGIIPKQIAKISGTSYVNKHFPEMQMECIDVEYAAVFGDYLITFKDKDGNMYSCVIGPYLFPFSLGQGLFEIQEYYANSTSFFDSGSDLADHYPHFMAKIVEIHDNHLLVEPEEGMEEFKSADKFEIPLADVDNPAELQVDDSILIVYDGKILETYPAKLGEVYSVSKIMIIPVDNSKGSN